MSPFDFAVLRAELSGEVDPLIDVFAHPGFFLGHSLADHQCPVRRLLKIHQEQILGESPDTKLIDSEHSPQCCFSEFFQPEELADVFLSPIQRWMDLLSSKSLSAIDSII